MSVRASRTPVCVAALALAGCTSIATPPEPRDDFVEVLLIDEVCHKGLVLPDEHGALVEWGFGHFGWYALEENEWWRVPRTVFWPGAGTLSRRAWNAAERARRDPLDVVTFRAAPERVRALSKDLQSEFDAARATLHHSTAWDTDFVRSSRRYWLFHDCHDATARWLGRLGCRVEPALVRIGLELRPRSRPAD